MSESQTSLLPTQNTTSPPTSKGLSFRSPGSAVSQLFRQAVGRPKNTNALTEIFQWQQDGQTHDQILNAADTHFGKNKIENMPEFGRFVRPTKLSLTQVCKALDIVTGSRLYMDLRTLNRKVGNWKSLRCGTSGSTVDGFDASKIPKYPLAWDDDLEPLVRDVIEKIAECTNTDREPSCDQS